MLGFSSEDMKELMSLEGISRSCKFWTPVSTVPRSIIYQIQERISVDGFRWAPQTLTGPKATFEMPGSETATVTEHRGLDGVWDILRIDEPRLLNFTQQKFYYLFETRHSILYHFCEYSYGQGTEFLCDALVIQRASPPPHPTPVSDAVCLARVKAAAATPELVDLPHYVHALRAAVGYGPASGEAAAAGIAAGIERKRGGGGGSGRRSSYWEYAETLQRAPIIQCQL